MSSWERLAAFEGGSVSWLATATAADGAEHVFAATAVGVFRSVDRGLTWQPLGGASRVAGVEVVVASPRYAEDGTVFAGALDGLFRWQVGQADQTEVSDHTGQEGRVSQEQPGWDHLLTNARVLGLAVLPGDDGRLTLLAGTEDDGILISRDSGRTWTGANPGLLDLTILALAVSPEFAQDGLAFAATPSGLFRTRNGAESWRIVELDWDDVAVQCLAVSPTFAEDRVVLAGTEDHGLLRSDDAGRTWEQVAELADLMINGLHFRADGWVIAATDAGVGLSDDDGETWRLAGQDLGGVAGAMMCGSGPETALLVGLPDSGAPIVPGTPSCGIARSVDGGQTWTAANDGLAASLVVDLALSGTFAEDDTLFVAGLESGLNVSRDGGQTWNGSPPDLDGAMVNLVKAWRSPSGESCLMVSTELGAMLSRDAGATWSAAVHDQLPGPAQAIAVAADAEASSVALVLTNGRAVASSDAVATWAKLALPSVSGQVVTLTLSPAYAQDGTLYLVLRGGAGATAADGVTLWRTTDRGQRWDRWLEIPDVPGGGVQLAALPDNRWGDAVLLGLGGQVYRPRQGSWEVSAGRRRPVWDVVTVAELDAAGRVASLTGLAASPAYASDRTLFAATSAGVFVSRDGGASFRAWSEGLEPLAMVAVAVSPSYEQDRLIFALGLGGSVWRRHDT